MNRGMSDVGGERTLRTPRTVWYTPYVSRVLAETRATGLGSLSLRSSSDAKPSSMGETRGTKYRYLREYVAERLVQDVADAARSSMQARIQMRMYRFGTSALKVVG